MLVRFPILIVIFCSVGEVKLGALFYWYCLMLEHIVEWFMSLSNVKFTIVEEESEIVNPESSFQFIED
jgi:hypothetical protein